MSQTPSTSKKAQRAICFRVDEEQHKLIAAAAGRKNTSPSDYCRELAIAHVSKPHEEETISGVYRVALATLEDVLATKAILFRTMMTLLYDERSKKTGIEPEDRQQFLASLPEPIRSGFDEDGVTRHHIAGLHLRVAEETKKEKARQRLTGKRADAQS